MTALLPRGVGPGGTVALEHDLAEGVWRERDALRGPRIPPDSRFAAVVPYTCWGFARSGGRQAVACPPLTPPPASLIASMARRPKWRRAVFLPLLNMATGDRFTFIARTANARDCVRRLINAFAAQPEGDVRVPLIELASEPRPLSEFYVLEPGDPEWFYRAALPIVGWTTADEINAVIARAQ
jgi:hypothetical protein